MHEPGRPLVFGDAKPDAASKNEGPAPLVFDAPPRTPRGGVPERGAPAPARTPGEALRFPEAPVHAPVPAPQPNAPRAAVFAPAPPAPLHPPAACATEPVAPAAAPRGPRAVHFPASAPTPRGRQPGGVAFDVPRHALHATVLAKAAALEPQTYCRDEARIERLVGELLPVRMQALEDYGAHMLEQGRQNALQAARVVQRFAQIRSSETLEAVVKSINTRPSLKESLLSRLGASTFNPQVALAQLSLQLRDTLRETRAVLPEVQADGQRIALLVLALRSVSEVCGPPPDAGLERALEMRLHTLRAALAQALMLPAQLQSQERVASEHLAECDRLQSVTLSAVQFANSGKPR